MSPEVVTNDEPFAKFPPSTVVGMLDQLSVPEPFVVNAYPLVPAVVGNVNV